MPSCRSVMRRRRFGQYLKNGGFMFSEEIRQSDNDGGRRKRPVFQVLRLTVSSRRSEDPLVLGSDGSKWQNTQDAPTLLQFWDFSDGPPMGGARKCLRYGNVGTAWSGCSCFSDLNISWYWGDPLADARERGLQFGVNLIVYAVTRWYCQRYSVYSIISQSKSKRAPDFISGALLFYRSLFTLSCYFVE